MMVMSLQYPLQGKVAAITGAASGIGFASAQAMANAGARVVFFPGSTLGNFEQREAIALLRTMAIEMGRQGAALVGIDLKKDAAILEAAYNDAAGVTREFTLNLLTRINRELGGDFDLAAFRHQAVWNADHSRIEMHLVSERDQVVSVAGGRFRFAAGETIHTENSYKFTLEGFADLAAEAGWKLERNWESPAPSFAVVLLRA